MQAEQPLQLAGAINAYCALLAERAGFRALYLSGAGVANASLGLPDLGLTTLQDVCEDLRRITGVTRLPVLVDADTGWGPALMIACAIGEVERAGAAGCSFVDQVRAKRCGHRPGKALVSAQEMTNRVKAAADGRTDPAFFLIARTDALASEGLEPTVQRACRYVEAGADAIFLEAAASLDDYRRFTAAVKAPVLASITEFGKTPLFSVGELREAGVRLAIYPLSAFRAMSAAAAKVYEALRREGTQNSLIGDMQTREELYEVLRYLDYERKEDS